MAQLGIPGLDGWRAAEADARAREGQDLQRLSGVLGLQGLVQQQGMNQMKMQQAQEDRARAAGLRDLIAQDPRIAGNPLLQAAAQSKPDSVLEYLMPKPKERNPMAVSDGYLKPTPDGGFEFVRTAEKAPKEPELALLHRYRERLPPGSPLVADVDAKIAKLTAPARTEDDRAELLRVAASLRAPAPPAPVTSLVVQDPSSPTGWSYKDGRTGQVLSQGAPAPASVNAGLRIDNTASNQLQRQYNGAVRPHVDTLGSVAAYRNARETGDNAQAMTMAAEALRRAARGGSSRFKGEVNRILGGGYGGGSLVERMDNFLNTQLTGVPSKQTVERLDRLADAAEDAILETVANQTRFYAKSASGRNLPLRQVVGDPFVQGKKVVFPDGTFATFKDDAAANAAAQKWLESNR